MVEVMQVRLFGELEAVAERVRVLSADQAAGPARPAGVAAGAPGSADRLIDSLWGDGHAANSANAVQAQIVQLRRTLGAAAIVVTEAGYDLAVGPGDVEVIRFEQLVAEGRRLAADGGMAPDSAALGEALSLRRGEPLAEFATRLRCGRTSAAGPAGPGGDPVPSPERTWCWAADGVVGRRPGDHMPAVPTA